MTVSNEPVRMWKEVALVNSEAVFLHLLGESEEHHKSESG